MILLDEIRSISFNGYTSFPMLLFSQDVKINLKEPIICEYQGLLYSLETTAAFTRMPWEVICVDYTMEVV